MVFFLCQGIISEGVGGELSRLVLGDWVWNFFNRSPITLKFEAEKERERESSKRERERESESESERVDVILSS